IKASMGEKAVLTGHFTSTEAKKIAALINAAASGTRAKPLAAPRLQLRLVAGENDTAPADDFAKPTGLAGQTTQVRVLKNILLDESAVASAEAPGPEPASLPVTLAIGQRDDVVFIVLGKDMLGDVVGLLAGDGSKKSLANQGRFQSAFKKLPPPEDGMEFFDMQALLTPIGDIMETVFAEMASQGDAIENRGMSDEANELSGRAMAAYNNGDMKEALALIKQAHDAEPRDSVVMYNVACFSALSDKPGEALDWLDKAVEGGFHAPGKITGDSDLTSLRDDPRYEQIVVKAARKVAQPSVQDVVINSTKSGEAYELCKQAWSVYDDQDYAQGLKLVREAHFMAPNDSRVLYYLACFHALTEDKGAALDYLEKAVDGGFYSPQHIARDPDLEIIRGHDRYRAALAAATSKAAEAGARDEVDWATVATRLTSRVMNAVGVLDYVATVHFTDEYATRAESIASLVADAERRPIYSVFGKQPQLTKFDRYLPAETESFSVNGGIDLGELYTFLEDTLRDVGPAGEKLLEQWSQIQKNIGFDLRKDLLDWFSGEIVNVTLADDGGSVLLIKVNDEAAAREKVGAAIEGATKLLKQLATKNPMLAMMSVRTSPSEDQRLEGFQNVYLMMSPEPAVWGVTDGHLVFATSADAAAACLETARGAHPSIRENDRLMSEAIVPDGSFASVSLTDQRRLGQELAMAIGMVSGIAGMATMAIPDPEIQQVVSKIAAMLGKLSPVANRIDFYKSSASHTTFDGRAWHTRKVTHYVSPAERRAAPEVQANAIE
ncbi:MAG: hypothetical protein V3W34_00565, partial [Phycisphaerae bacterium]